MAFEELKNIQDKAEAYIESNLATINCGLLN
jgi:hypothetical protein